MFILISDLVLASSIVHPDTNWGENSQLKFSSTEMKNFLDNLVAQGKISQQIRQDCNNDDVSIRCANMNSLVFGDYIASKILLTQFKRAALNYANNPMVKNNVYHSVENSKYLALFTCMENQYKNLTITCQTNHGGLVAKSGAGYCPFNVFGYVSPSSRKGEVFIGPIQHLGPSTKLRACTYLHEVSHHCGAIDFEYYGSGQAGQYLKGQAKNSRFSGSKINADNLCLMAYSGYCIPGFNCPNVNNKN